MACFLKDDLFLILKEKLKDNSTSFVFHTNGEPLSYRSIQYQYNKALKACNLYPCFSGTHFIRHSMATLTRRVTKSLELTQAMTGHKDQKMVQHYASMDIESNKEAQMQVLEFMRVNS